MLLEVIDVRDLEYFMGHITNSRHVPSAFFEERLDELVKSVAGSGKTIVFHCDDSKRLAPWCAELFVRYLEDNGSNLSCKVRVLQGGFQRWRQLCSGAPDMDRFIQVESSLSLFTIHSEEELPPMTHMDH